MGVDMGHQAAGRTGSRLGFSMRRRAVGWQPREMQNQLQNQPRVGDTVVPAEPQSTNSF